jgi:hypothetical protein
MQAYVEEASEQLPHMNGKGGDCWVIAIIGQQHERVPLSMIVAPTIDKCKQPLMDGTNPLMQPPFLPINRQQENRAR